MFFIWEGNYVQWQLLFQHEFLCTQMYFPGKSCLCCCRWQMNWNDVFWFWEIPLNFFNSILFWQHENSYYFSSWNTLKSCNNELHRTTDRYNRKQGDRGSSVPIISSALQPIWKHLICVYLTASITHFKKYLSYDATTQ